MIRIITSQLLFQNNHFTRPDAICTKKIFRTYFPVYRIIIDIITDDDNVVYLK